jgi:hypothetical protein
VSRDHAHAFSRPPPSTLSTVPVTYELPMTYSMAAATSSGVPTRRAGSGDLELAVDLIFGAMWYRLLNRHAEVNEELAEEIAGLFARIR